MGAPIPARRFVETHPGYYVYCSYGTVVQGGDAAEATLTVDSPGGSPDNAHYKVGDFPDAQTDPLEVRPLGVILDRTTVILRERKPHDGSPVSRYAIMRKRGTRWITLGILAGPKDDSDQDARPRLVRLCEQTWPLRAPGSGAPASGR